MPEEVMELRDDEVLRADEDVIVTRWFTPNPKPEFTHGASCCFRKEGYKVSKMFGEGNAFRYYYCDIVELSEPEAGSVVCEDLLLDVVVYADGTSHVLDLDEAVSAYREGIIGTEQLLRALDALDRLLKVIYAGRFGELTGYVDGLWGEESDT